MDVGILLQDKKFPFNLVHGCFINIYSLSSSVQSDPSSLFPCSSLEIPNVEDEYVSGTEAVVAIGGLT